ncbi:ferredoxin [Laccaria bicolor S238N-H82]|uniref:Ferredoxin n=1 Tax=Laccaria bicolor (strain S238N-H82 / ATCC MYA-4686) TaxID=486041 RepID=B0D568_LACBS|nr:ferredoxin [Laccaria bicolor S238N-H82]EDR10224.1 ferredoxin [Laccaria bicolor S238N-H82]|eukprot:XP_001878674.1 ferredoxin [Laccaria bicolor S238N-H82]
MTPSFTLLRRSLGRLPQRTSPFISAKGNGRGRRTRSLHTSAVSQHSGINRPAPGTGIKVHFKDSKGNLLKTVEANEGDDVLAIAHEYDIDLEGACEGSVACSTCHVILPPEYYDLLPEPEDDENDMLDMAFGLTDTSRLGCQVKLTRELDGLTATLPSATRNMFVDGKKASH